MRKSKKYIDNAPTIKQLDKLWNACVKERAKWKSEISNDSRDKGFVMQAHHIMHKPCHRLRWELKNGVCLTKNEHMSYHEYEKRAFKSEREKADRMREQFMFIRETTEEEMLMFKRQSSADKFSIKLYLEQKLKEFKGI